MSWTEERVERLKALWHDGLTASQIARELGGVSRNAVIGKVHRLGLSNRAQSGRPSEPAATTDAEETAAPQKAAAETTNGKDMRPRSRPAPESAPDKRSGGETETPFLDTGETVKKTTAAAASSRQSQADEAQRARAEAPSAEAASASDDAMTDTVSLNDDAESGAENSVATLAAEAEKSARKLSLLELNERTCKWPIGDPSTDDFYFCGLRCAPDKPYCEAHAALAYQPMSSRRDRERSRSRARAVSA